MLLFLDTEFSSLEQSNPSLISLALVREDGDFFYAEAPSASYLGRASPWVHEHVLPLLWNGSYRMLLPDLSANVVAWIEAVPERTMIVTDAPDFDFELMLKPLLDLWPRNLARQAMLFDSYSMGVDRQEWLGKVMADYHAAGWPAHHALHDAQALRAGLMAALERGWRPPRPYVRNAV